MTRYLFVLLCCWTNLSQGQMYTQEFTFSYDSLNYSGFLHMPEDLTPKAWITLIPGSGKTDFGGTSGWSRWFGELRENFVNQGLGVCVWDRPGCGRSEGTFDANQAVEGSAGEALAAMAYLREENLPGSQKIGLWGMSRGGWICPLIIQADSSIAFWISVSGVDSVENSNYLLETNLILSGQTAEYAAKLASEKRVGNRIFFEGGSYQDFLDATSNMRVDSFYLAMFGKHWEQKSYEAEQETFLNVDTPINSLNAVGDPIFLPGFDSILQSVHCPVLAIFGEKDSQVDWRSAQNLYETTFRGKIPLEVVSFPNGNHILKQCETGAIFEDLEKFGYENCEGYFDAMNRWLGRYVLSE